MIRHSMSAAPCRTRPLPNTFQLIVDNPSTCLSNHFIPHDSAYGLGYDWIRTVFMLMTWTRPVSFVFSATELLPAAGVIAFSCARSILA